MSLINDVKYIEKISGQLSGFEQKSKYLWVCRCPICEDSKQNKKKKRGYFILGKDKDSMVFFCQNCSANMSVWSLLKDVFPEHYGQYRLDGMVSGSRQLTTKIVRKPANTTLHKKVEASKFIFNVSELPESHLARQYLNYRKLDTSMFMYTPNFCNYIAEQTNNDDRYIKLPKDQRIIIPLYSQDKQIVGVQGRALDPKANMRYITIKFDEDNYHKIFGLDRFDKNKNGFIVEGPFDSTFLPNALAMCGSSLDMSIIDKSIINPEKIIIAFDNESRNHQIVQKMEKMIDIGFRVFIPPKELSTNLKDINKMVMEDGWTKRQLVEFYVKNSYTGLRAKAVLVDWRRDV